MVARFPVCKTDTTTRVFLPGLSPMIGVVFGALEFLEPTIWESFTSIIGPLMSRVTPGKNGPDFAGRRLPLTAKLARLQGDWVDSEVRLRK